MFFRFWLFTALALASLSGLPAEASIISLAGFLNPAVPTDVALIPFSTAASAALTIQSYGYGGTANTPAGTNAAGAVIAPGGFEPYLSLFAGIGPAATFLASAGSPGACPPATGAPYCGDPQLTKAALPAGAYTLAISLPGNISFAENYGLGILGDGFTGLVADYGGATSAYAIDITSAALVPAPGGGACALALLAAACFRRSHRSNSEATP